MHNWAGVGWGRRSTDHSLLILARASRFKHVYSSTIFENILKPSNSIHFYICLNEIWWQFNWDLQPEVDLLTHQIGGQGLVSLKRPDLYFVIHRNNTTEKVFGCTIFILPVHDTILCPSRAKDTRFRPYAQKIHVSKISNPTKSFDPLRHLKSLAPGRGHGKEVTRFFLFTSTVFNILLLHRTTEYIPYQDSRGPFSKFT